MSKQAIFNELLNKAKDLQQHIPASKHERRRFAHRADDETAQVAVVQDAIDDVIKKLGGTLPETENEPETESEDDLSPMMKQYQELKEKHPDSLLLFRCDDFYETYHDDAETAAKKLGITLTKKGDTRMAGFPHHALDTYLPKLVRAGLRVAICNQLEEPKKLVKRGITEIVSSQNKE